MVQKILQMLLLLNMENYLQMEDHKNDIEMDHYRVTNPIKILLDLKLIKIKISYLLI